MMIIRTIKSITACWGIVLLLLTLSAPAMAHKEHKKPEQTEQVTSAPGSPAQTADPGAMHPEMSETMKAAREDRSTMSTFPRLLDWLGRLHPMIVHFPIAFFIGALFTAVIGRRRPAFAAPVQFLVVAGGILAPVSAITGWLNAVGADPDPLLEVHRWIGTGIAIGGLGLAGWALAEPGRDRSIGMIIGLSVIAAAIIVQGWYGAAMIHGVDHMNW